MTTIRDIARLSGYSITTVSRVLNQHGYVSQATRTQIEQVIQETNYVPNGVARDLSMGKTHTIGVVLPHASHPYFTQLIQGIMQAAFLSEYRITLLPSEYNQKLENKYLEQLRRKLFDGLIFTSHGLPLPRLAAYLAYDPIVICEDPGENNLPAVYSERRNGYLAAFHWLKEQNLTRIAFLFSRPVAASATGKATMQAFQAVYGRLPAAEWVIDDVVTFADGFAAAGQLVAADLDLQAIFTNGDDIAAGVRQCYQDQRLPEPLLVGQDNQLAGFLLKLPTIDHHFQEIGAQAFRLVTQTSEARSKIAMPSEFLLGDQRSTPK
ncbi:LacI family DNA-binding transcriptional regulator [Lactobacillus sp. DCY120]|uniref:LacI family DNA-binding transcriptional regulator n=1 Tax=Bombilactobacillus apium TaxID=2675299 RepID=A0A850QWF9_9LACO|nr:LacI family DNA-binding transcriptional regulator [Bombilactobacillus apium]NVY96134.1 LacI family DNA-binding transcriptional regulator [Bombilactobacillus apium]